MTKIYDVVIVGGGIIGTMINHQLAKYQLKILQLEKNSYLADETSHGNSGLIHSGFDAEGEIESKLNQQGKILWKQEILPNLEIPHVNIPSLILAFSKMEDEEVKKLYDRGLRNGLDRDEMKILNHDEIIKLEPYVNRDVTSGLIAYSSVAIDPVVATRALATVALLNGSEIQKNATVTKITKDGEDFIVEINHKEQVRTKNVINAAGHYADEIAKLASEGDFRLVAKRGEYRILAKSETHKIHHVLFKVPTIHGKGVIVAPMLDGRTLVGPTAEDHISKDETRLITIEKYGLIGDIGRYIIPSLNLDKTEKSYSGSRPIYPVTNDFLIGYGDHSKHFINVAGMQSPALASAPAIALEVEKLLQNNGTKLDLKPNYVKQYKAVW